ncbi:glycosyltransferase family 2 protein [Candidatus Gottesmanbacteria bacterium]|nr:glycosyltransferase family 2 protein [Candidatus Gottesmanbacteria bacterium]
MNRLFERYPEKTARAIEIIIPSITWFLITLPFWLSFFHPALVAYLVIAFDVYWFYKSATLAINAIRSYLTLSSHVRVDWLSLCKQIKGWDSIHHVIIIPEFKEPLSILRDTLTNLTKQDFPLKSISIVLSTEDRDLTADQTGEILRKEFGMKFANFWIIKHKLNSNEVAGKSSNMANAGRFVSDVLIKKGYDLSKVTVTSCDADILLHPKYYSNLTYQFLTDPDSRFRFYQAAVLFYSNIWRLPIPGRVLNTISSILNLAMLKQGKRLINFSTYSICLDTVKKVGFWGVDIIPEDYHLFFKTYFALGEKVRVTPIFLPVLADAAESSTFWKTMINQYEQHKRWAWGVSDIPFVVHNYFTNKTIPFWDKTGRLVNLLEQHILWPTNWFILTIWSSIPPLINPYFARTVLGHNLSQISSAILTICAIFILVIIFLDAKMKPQRPAHFSKWKLPILYLQWLSLPFISFFLSALPGLDAHTRLLLGKRLEYRVTEKV